MIYDIINNFKSAEFITSGEINKKENDSHETYIFIRRMLYTQLT